MRKIIHWLTGLLFSVAVIIILLISAFEIAMYANFGFYRQEYEKYDVLSELDMTMEDTMYVTREMMAYLRGEREELSVITTVEGEEQDFFNEQDRFHMGEVREMFLGGLNLRLAASAAAVVCLVILIFSKAETVRILAKSYQMILGILAIMLGILGIAVARDFNAVFTLFHEIFFDNDLWLFDPATDYMIRMLPEGLFFDFVIRIGAMFVGGLMILLLLSIICTKKCAKCGTVFPHSSTTN